LCTKEIHRLGPMDLKIYSPERTHDCDSTADKVSRLVKSISVTSISGSGTSRPKPMRIYRVRAVLTPASKSRLLPQPSAQF
jgi:hypothetical protein